MSLRRLDRSDAAAGQKLRPLTNVATDDPKNASSFISTEAAYPVWLFSLLVFKGERKLITASESPVGSGWSTEKSQAQITQRGTRWELGKLGRLSWKGGALSLLIRPRQMTRRDIVSSWEPDSVNSPIFKALTSAPGLILLPLLPSTPHQWLVRGTVLSETVRPVFPYTGRYPHIWETPL